MRVLVAMSGGVDSSVAAALLAERLGRDQVVGATLKLWGGSSDSGCCSVADVEDARRVAEQLGLVHHVFNFAAEFEERVVDPYVQGHADGRTPNPCIECNRHLKFDRLLDRARALGFDAVATGHHARRVAAGGGRFRLCRGADPLKDQSYVLAMLGQDQLARSLFPVGEMTKAQVRDEAHRLGLRTAAKPDSQDVCFIRSDEGRQGFLGARLPLHAGRLVDHDTGEDLGAGRGRGAGHGGTAPGHGPQPGRFAPLRDRRGRPDQADLTRLGRGRPGPEVRLHTVTWIDGDPLASGSTAGSTAVVDRSSDGEGRSAGSGGLPVIAQCSAHGRPVAATVGRAVGPDRDGAGCP